MAEAAAVAHQRRRKLTEHEYDEEQGEEEDDGLGAWRPNSRHTADAWAGWSSSVASQSDKRLLKSRSFLDDPRRFERYEHTNTRDAAAFGTSFPRSQTVSVEARPAGSGRSMGRVRSLSRAHDVRTEQEGDASGGQVSEAAEVAGAPQNVTVPGMKLSSQSAHCVPAAKAEILPGLLPSAAHLEPIHEQGQDEDQALVGGNRDAVSGFKGDGRAAMLARKVAVAAAGLCVGLAAIPSEGVSTKIDAEPTTAGDGNGEEEAAKGGGGEGQQPMSVDGGPDAIGIKLGLDTQGPAACLHESPSLCGQVQKGCEGAGTCGGGGAGASAHACTRLCVPFSSSSLPDSESLEEEELKDIDDEVLQEVFWRVHKAKVQLENYCNVLMFFIFVAIYFAMMYLQADSTNGYEVAHGHEPLLPPGFAADQPNSFNSREEFYTWLNDSIIQVYWKDPQCGNGVCEAPLEYPAFGSQGCEADCGKMQNLTTIFISINTNFDTDEARAASSWNLCMTSPVNLCWFPSYQDFPDLLSHISLSLDVPDGDWAVWLNAPRGGVRGTVNSPMPGLSRIAVSGTQQMKLLTSWGQCMSEELSPISRCRGVCSIIVTCISSMACGKHVSQQQLSGVFVECANQCKAEPEPLLVYENATCSKVLRELPELVPMQNCSSRIASRGLASENSHVEVHMTFYGTNHDQLRREQGPEKRMPQSRRLNDRIPSQDEAASAGNQPTAGLVRAAERLTLIRQQFSADNALSSSSAPWAFLGPSDTQRTFNLKVAVARMKYTQVKHKCLAEYPVDMSPPAIARFTAFLCTLFGGPVKTLPACNYTDATSKRQLISSSELLAQMQKTHKRGTKMSRQHQVELTELLMSAIQSVVELPDTVSSVINSLLRAFDDAVISNEVPGCNLDGPVLLWQEGQRHITTIRAGGKVTWVWGDDEPHSVKLSGTADADNPFFKGFGSGRLVLSRRSICSPLLIGPHDDNGVPTPCVLRPFGDTSSGYTYTKVFNQPGVIFYTGGRFGASNSGVLTVLPQEASNHSDTERFPGLQRECSRGCPYGNLGDGQCNSACFVADCAFDGGDCACSSPDLDFSRCTCSSGQTRSDTGECCRSTAYGESLSFPFTVRTYGADVTQSNKLFAAASDVPIERYISDRNRLLVGMYLAQHRWSRSNCSWRPFSYLMSSCLGTPSSEPFGVNPHFLPSSSLFNADAAANIDLYDNGTFGTKLKRNSQGLPFGFIYPQEGLEMLPMVFDINLRNDAATNRLQYLVDGFYIDSSTRSIDVMFLTYNSDTAILTVIEVKIKVGAGGRMAAGFNIHPLKLQDYSWGSSEDVVRFVLEIIVLACVLLNLVGEVVELLRTKYETGLAVLYFRNLWNWVDLISIALQLTCAGLWIYIVTLTNSLVIEPRYNIYFTLLEFPRYWVTPNPPTGFDAAMEVYNQIHYIIGIRALYFVLQGINVLLLTVRLLKLFDFQPYLGFITRAIRVAAPSLAHFFFLWFIVYLSFSLYGYIVFGATVYMFSTFSQSMLTCFLIILNDNSVYYYFMQLDGWQHVAGIVFLVVYTLVMVFVLLNFLIAIIVDAFMDVKDAGSNSTTIADDLIAIAKGAKATYGNGYGGGYSKLLRQLQRISADQVYGREATELVESHSLKPVISHFNNFRVLLGFNRQREAPHMKKVIQFGNRTLDSTSIDTILQRAKERSAMAGPERTTKSNPGTPRTQQQNLATRLHLLHSHRHRRTVDTQRMSETLMELLGADTVAEDLPVSHPSHKQLLFHKTVNAEDFEEACNQQFSELKVMINSMQEQLLEISAKMGTTPKS